MLEDLHWADDSTLLLTEYLAPLLPEMPVRIIGTYRDDEVDISHPLSRMINQLGRRRLIDRISLHRLSFGGVRAMVEALAGQPPPEELVRVIDSETEGNPFFVEELYLHLAESGVLLDERGRVRADLKVAEASVPESIRLVVGERLSRLSRRTREALVAAAVSGRIFAPDFVGEVAGVDADALVDAFEEAEGARLIAPVKGDGNLAFSHELIRQSLLAELSTLKRERLHLQAANAIERRYADDLEEHAADLTHHLSRAGRLADRPRLVRYLTIAGERAADAAAFDDAVAHFEQALSLLERGNRDTRAELLERLAMALRSVGRWDDAMSTMNEALDLYQALGRTDALGRLSWAMVSQLTWTARVPEAVQAAQRALGALGDIASADKARLLSAMAWAIGLGNDHATAKQMFDQARALADQVGDERALADVLHMETATISDTPNTSKAFLPVCARRRCSTVKAHCGICAACRRSSFTRTERWAATSRRSNSPTRPWPWPKARPSWGDIPPAALPCPPGGDSRGLGVARDSRAADSRHLPAGQPALALRGPSLPRARRPLARRCCTRRSGNPPRGPIGGARRVLRQQYLHPRCVTLPMWVAWRTLGRPTRQNGPSCPLPTGQTAMAPGFACSGWSRPFISAGSPTMLPRFPPRRERTWTWTGLDHLRRTPRAHMCRHGGCGRSPVGGGGAPLRGSRTARETHE